MDLKTSRFNRVIIGVHNQTEEELMLSATFPLRKNWFEEARGASLRERLSSQFGPEEFPRWATVRRAQLEIIAGNLALRTGKVDNFPHQSFVRRMMIRRMNSFLANQA